MKANARVVLIAALSATAALAAGAAGAANMATNSATTPANKELGKFSADGATAFQDMLLTRRAIFDGKIEDAKKYVALAESGFDKAKSDETVFTKAEADLHPPVPNTVAAKMNASVNSPADSGDADRSAKSKLPVAWVPVDGSITLAEDITGNSAKASAVGEANKSLQSGDREGALKKLEGAGIKVAIVVAVMPLQETIERVHKAAEMIDAGKYYEGSQELRMAQADERFDMVGDLGTPKE